MAGAVDRALIETLHGATLGELRPDLTLILDVPVAQGLARRGSSGRHRYERMPAAFHERVRAGFLAMARAEPERCLVIDASRGADEVASDVRALVARRFGLDLAQSG